MSCFPEGLLLKHLIYAQQARFLRSLNDNYLFLLLQLTIMPINEGSMNDNLFDYFPTLIGDQKSLNYTDYDIIKDFVSQNQMFKCNGFLVFSTSTTFKNEELVVMVNPVVRRVVSSMKQMKTDLFDGFVDCTKFHLMIMNSAIFSAKCEFLVFEELLDFSSLNRGKLWEGQSGPLEINLLMPELIEEMSASIFQIKSILKFYEPNYIALLANQDILTLDASIEEMILKEDEEDLAAFVGDMTDFLLKMLTMYRICEYNQECIDLINMVRLVYNKDSKRKKSKELIFKIELFLVDMMYSSAKTSLNNYCMQAIDPQYIWDELTNLEDMALTAFDDESKKYITMVTLD